MAASLKTNSIYSLIGFAVPTVVLFGSYPLLLAALGKEGFGVFNVATTLGGMVAFLDFGFGAATIKYLASALARGDRDEGRATVQASLRFFTAAGVLVGGIAFLLAPWMVRTFRVPDAMQESALLSFRVAAFQVVLVFQLNVFVAILKGMQLFRFSSMATAALATLNYGGATVVTAGMGFGLVGATVSSTVACGIVAAAAGLTARRALRKHGMWSGDRPENSAYMRLASFGSVTTINGVASMVVTQLPRYVVAAIYGPAAVSVYTIAFSVGLRVHAVAAAATETFFPFTSSARSLGELRKPYRIMLFGSAVLAAATAAPLALGARPILELWVGTEMAEAAAPLLRVFTLAYLVNALSPAPFYLANGIGRPLRNTVFISTHIALYAAFVAALLRFSDLGLLSVAYGHLAANTVAVAGLLVATERLFRRERTAHDNGAAEDSGVPGSPAQRPLASAGAGVGGAGSAFPSEGES